MISDQPLTQFFDGMGVEIKAGDYVIYKTSSRHAGLRIGKIEKFNETEHQPYQYRPHPWYTYTISMKGATFNGSSISAQKPSKIDYDKARILKYDISQISDPATLRDLQNL